MGNRPEPVLLAFLLGAVPLVAGFVLQILEALPDSSTPLWLRTALVGIGTLTTALGALWARIRVTPTSDPQLDGGTPLVPATPGRDVV
jgi:hypothetical protein